MDNQYSGKHASTKKTYAGGINMGTQPHIASTTAGYLKGMRIQPFAGDNNRNMQPQQFGSGSRANGNVKSGYNPLTYQGGSHRAPGRLG
jgi:hypothetical protein